MGVLCLGKGFWEQNDTPGVGSWVGTLSLLSCIRDMKGYKRDGMGRDGLEEVTARLIVKVHNAFINIARSSSWCSDSPELHYLDERHELPSLHASSLTHPRYRYRHVTTRVAIGPEWKGCSRLVEGGDQRLQRWSIAMLHVS